MQSRQNPHATEPRFSHGETRRSRPSGRPANPGKRLVLYVEDNATNALLMEDLFEALDDVELVTVSTAELGLAVARTLRPDLILMDINLPGISGLDAMRELRLDRDTRDIPVVALTAATSSDDRSACEQAGFRRYLTKPIHMEEIERALFEVMPKSRRPS